MEISAKTTEGLEGGLLHRARRFRVSGILTCALGRDGEINTATETTSEARLSELP